MGISRGCAVSYFLLPPVFSFYREYILFCRWNFSFTLTYFFLPRAFFFCRDYLSFAAEISVLPRNFFFFVTYFFFSAGDFLLPGAFSFCDDQFLFCREHFSFTVEVFLLPGAFFFCGDTCRPPYFLNIFNCCKTAHFLEQCVDSVYHKNLYYSKSCSSQKKLNYPGIEFYV